ncbi:acyltransferase [Aetokthonos hydrillicola CCALA 1050]|nr:acyltransferase [Aetokthonos hydrillicola CCALA 1050]
MRYGKFPSLYRKFCQPSGEEYAEYLRRHGSFYSLGQNCSILPTSTFTDPAYVSIGNNVHFSSCTLIGHDGSIAMLNRAYNVKLDSVGKIDIRDNVFIGYNAIILPNVTIGQNSIIAAGAVVTKDVTEGDIVAGVPAKPIGRVENLVKKLQDKTQSLSWFHLIEQRAGAFDPELESQLIRLRVSHFYGNAEHTFDEPCISSKGLPENKI